MQYSPSRRKKVGNDNFTKQLKRSLPLFIAATSGASGYRTQTENVVSEKRLQTIPEATTAKESNTAAKKLKGA